MFRNLQSDNKNHVKVFHELSNKEQNDIRRRYKQERYKDYRYSIHLYILYVFLGIVSLSGIFLCYLNTIIGATVFILGFLLMIINIYFLIKSNANFYKYLNSIGYVYDKNKRC